MINILTERIFKVGIRPQRVALLTLPEIMSALVRDEVTSFKAVRPHQRQAWHAFLVQLAAIACHRGEISSDLPDESGAWLQLIRVLTSDFADDAPWCLVIDDFTRPAFLQPPASNPRQKTDYKGEAPTPDALDMLVTAKNHDLKSNCMATARPEDWIHALISLQTQEGVMGAGNYGISRMNGGYGSRSSFGIVPAGGPGARFIRDVRRLLSGRDEIWRSASWLNRTDGISLIWLETWSGVESLSPNRLDPFYIEICRRVRLSYRGDRLVALTAGSKAPRIEAKALKGVTGDPWGPVHAGEPKALSLTAEGFSYRRSVDLLSKDKFVRPRLAEVDEEDAVDGLTFLATGLARGQGKTEGFHERRIPVSRTVGRLLTGREATDRIAEIGRQRVEIVGGLQGRVLRPALFSLLQGGPNEVEYGKRTTGPQAEVWLERFNAEVDSSFFEALWEEVEAGETGGASASRAARAKWFQGLVERASTILLNAAEAAPRTTMRRYRARARSEQVFYGALKKNELLQEITDNVDATTI